MPSRSDEQFHDSVVSLLIRPGSCNIVLCAQASPISIFYAFSSTRIYLVKEGGAVHSVDTCVHSKI